MNRKYFRFFLLQKGRLPLTPTAAFSPVGGCLGNKQKLKDRTLNHIGWIHNEESEFHKGCGNHCAVPGMKIVLMEGFGIFKKKSRCVI